MSMYMLDFGRPYWSTPGGAGLGLPPDVNSRDNHRRAVHVAHHHLLSSVADCSSGFPLLFWAAVSMKEAPWLTRTTPGFPRRCPVAVPAPPPLARGDSARQDPHPMRWLRSARVRDRQCLAGSEIWVCSAASPDLIGAERFSGIDFSCVNTRHPSLSLLLKATAEHTPCTAAA